MAAEVPTGSAPVAGATESAAAPGATGSRGAREPIFSFAAAAAILRQADHRDPGPEGRDREHDLRADPGEMLDVAGHVAARRVEEVKTLERQRVSHSCSPAAAASAPFALRCSTTARRSTWRAAAAAT